MYKNIGKKIKGFSYCFAWILIAVCSFYAFYQVFSNDFSVESAVVSGLIVVSGCLVALILSWFIYAFGEIAQKSQEQNENLETLILLVDDLQKKVNAKQQNSATANKNELFLSDFKTSKTKDELLNSQLKKLKIDYEMSRITYDEYEERKKKLQTEYK